MTDDELMRRAEEYMDRLMAPHQGEPILCQKPVPPVDQLESWRKDAIRLGFDPEDVRLVFDGECFGIQLPGELVDLTIDEVW